MMMTMGIRLTKSLMKLGKQNRNKDNYNNKGSGLQDELCETVAEVYAYEPFEEYAKQDDEVGEFEKHIWITRESKSVLKLKIAVDNQLGYGNDNVT